METVKFSMGSNNHADCNSFYSMGCSPIYTKISVHLKIVQSLVNAQYQGIPGWSLFSRAMYLIHKSHTWAQNMNLITIE